MTATQRNMIKARKPVVKRILFLLLILFEFTGFTFAKDESLDDDYFFKQPYGTWPLFEKTELKFGIPENIFDSDQEDFHSNLLTVPPLEDTQLLPASAGSKWRNCDKVTRNY